MTTIALPRGVRAMPGFWTRLGVSLGLTGGVIAGILRAAPVLDQWNAIQVGNLLAWQGLHPLLLLGWGPANIILSGQVPTLGNAGALGVVVASLLSAALAVLARSFPLRAALAALSVVLAIGGLPAFFSDVQFQDLMRDVQHLRWLFMGAADASLVGLVLFGGMIPGSWTRQVAVWALAAVYFLAMAPLFTVANVLVLGVVGPALLPASLILSWLAWGTLVLAFYGVMVSV